MVGKLNYSPQKGRVGDGLSVCGDKIVLIVAQVDVATFEAAEDIFHHADFVVCCAMLNDNLQSAFDITFVSSVLLFYGIQVIRNP